MCENFPNSNLSEPGQKYPYKPKIRPGGLPVSSINSEHINIYTVNSRYIEAGYNEIPAYSEM